jgi:serine/threonine protein kinase
MRKFGLPVYFGDYMETFGTVSILPPGFILAGRYKIDRLIGQGGMGIVYAAEDTKLDGESRAVKTIRPELLLDQRGARQLRQEAMAAQRLSHPNIVRVYHFDSSDGISFLVMEFIEGRTISALLEDKEKLNKKEFLDIALNLCNALAYAHSQGVVHQDIKPSNVFIDGGGNVKLGDFGVARVAKDTTTRITGRLPSGTLVYMSPEVLAGRPPTSASDLYSLAILFYEMLRGEPPFVRGDIFRQHQEVPPKPIEGIDTRLSAAILRGLEKKPEDRPASVQEFRSLISGTPQTEHPKTKPEPTSRQENVIAVAPDAIETSAGAVTTGEQIHNCCVCGIKIKAVSDPFYRCPVCREYVCPDHYDTRKLICVKCLVDNRSLEDKIDLKTRWLYFWRLIYVLVLIPTIVFAVDVIQLVISVVNTRGRIIEEAVQARDYEMLMPLVALLIFSNLLGFVCSKKRRHKHAIKEIREKTRHHNEARFQ